MEDLIIKSGLKSLVVLFQKSDTGLVYTDQKDKCANLEQRVKSTIRVHLKAVGYRRGRGGESPRGALPKGQQHFGKNVKIYVKNDTIYV